MCALRGLADTNSGKNRRLPPMSTRFRERFSRRYGTSLILSREYRKVVRGCSREDYDRVGVS